MEEDDKKKLHERIEEILANAQPYFALRARDKAIAERNKAIVERDQAIQQRNNAIAGLERVKKMQAPPDRERERDENHENAQKFGEMSKFIDEYKSRAP